MRSTSLVLATSLVLVAALVLAVPGAAQMAMPAPIGSRPVCSATPAPPPPELAGWSTMAPVKAAVTTAELGLATLPLGRGTAATLIATSAVTYPLAPEHPAAPSTYGGLFAFTVTEAGAYRVGLDAGAWIDVVRDGRALRSTTHGHGPDCSGIRKTVDFPLAPGRYTLQVSGNANPSLGLIVARLPA